jgi:hypothetical protein
VAFIFSARLISADVKAAAGAPNPGDDSEVTRVQRAAHESKTALDSVVHLVLDRKPAARDRGCLRAATAERPECAGVSAGRCGQREGGTKRDRGGEPDFGDQQRPFY